MSLENYELIIYPNEANLSQYITYKIGKKETIIGRSKHKCDLVLIFSDISDIHAKLTILGTNDYTIRDLNSEAGVYRYDESTETKQRLNPGKEYDLLIDSHFFISRYKCVLAKGKPYISTEIKEEDEKDSQKAPKIAKQLAAYGKKFKPKTSQIESDVPDEILHKEKIEQENKKRLLELNEIVEEENLKEENTQSKIKTEEEIQIKQNEIKRIDEKEKIMKISKNKRTVSNLSLPYEIKDLDQESKKIQLKAETISQIEEPTIKKQISPIKLKESKILLKKKQNLMDKKKDNNSSELSKETDIQKQISKVPFSQQETKNEDNKIIHIPKDVQQKLKNNQTNKTKDDHSNNENNLQPDLHIVNQTKNKIKKEKYAKDLIQEEIKNEDLEEKNTKINNKKTNVKLEKSSTTSQRITKELPIENVKNNPKQSNVSKKKEIIEKDETIAKNFENNVKTKKSITINSKSLLHIGVSGFLLEEDELEKLKKIGIHVIENKNKIIDLLILKNFKRTIRFLLALNKGVEIIDKKWIDDCLEQNKILDYFTYQFKNNEIEKAMGFKIQKSLSRARNNKEGVFHGFSFWFPKNISPSYEEIKILILSGGGNILLKRPFLEEQNAIIIMSKEENEKIEKLKGDGFSIYSTELIFSACLKQELNLENNLL